MSVSRKIVIVLGCVIASLALGLIVVFSARRRAEEPFDSYRKALIDRRSSAAAGKANALAINSTEDLDFVHFSSSTLGWVGNHYGLLYATEDAGKTWIRRDIKSPVGLGNTYYPDMNFGLDTGWAIAQQKSKPGEDICQRVGSLLRTNDRGQTWYVLLTKNCTELLRIAVAGKNEVWILGHQFVQTKERVEGRFLILHTSDGGNRWDDVSELPNRLMMDSNRRVLESPASIVTTGEGSAMVITHNGYLLDATSGGRQWRRSGSIALHSVLPEAREMSDRSVTISAGVDGSHGTAGMVARRELNGNWTGSWFTDLYTRDALFLSDHEIVACGSLLPEERELLLNGEREGVILYSTDSGSNWTIIYRARDRKAVTALSLSPDGVINAVGSKGLLVEVKRP